MFTFHAIAKNEYRDLFPLTSIVSDYGARWNKTRIQPTLQPLTVPNYLMLQPTTMGIPSCLESEIE